MDKRLFRAILAHRTLVLVALAAASAFLGYFAADIRFDNSIESYFL